MRMRSVLLSGLLILTALSGRAAETYIIDARAVTGGNVFNSLEDLRTAIGTSVFLGQDDVIELRNDDATLTAPMELATSFPITVRSAAGGRYSIGSAVPSSSSFLDMFYVSGANPGAVFENIRIADTGRFSTTITSENTGLGTGTLTINNSRFENNGGTAVYLDGSHTVEINNSNFSGYTYNVQSNTAITLNANYDGNADYYNAWSGKLSISGTANFNIAEGRYLSIDNGIGTTSSSSAVVNKNGGGVLRLSGSNYVNNININQGTVHFGAGTMTTANSLYVGGQGVLKLSATPGNLEEYWRDPENVTPRAAISQFTLGTLYSAEGSRLEVGGVSRLPPFSQGNTQWTFSYPMIITDVNTATIASTLTINNDLLHAWLRPGDVVGYLDPTDPQEAFPDDQDLWSGYFLVIDRMNNLDILEGVGHYADIYRRSNLSQAERDLLDSIYARGGTAGADRGFLQTIGGHIVQNTLLAMRHNQANLIGKINRRLTAYQTEELKSNPLHVDSPDDPAYYSDWAECTQYGQMWASLDQTWMSQNDLENLAGYRYDTTTLTIGYDRHVDELIYGGALAYSTGAMTLKSDSATRSDIDHLLAAVYASWAREGWYISGTGIAGYGWNDSRSVYRLPGMHMSSRTGNYSTTTLGVNAEVGYMMETDFYGLPVRFTPYGGLTYARLHRQSVNDMGAYNDTVDLRKHYGAGDWNIWEGALGIRLAAPFERENYTLVPSLDVAWTRTTGDDHTNGGRIHMLNNAGNGWTVGLMSRNRSSYRTVAGVDMHLRNNFILGANYEFEWRRDYWRNQLNVNMSMTF